MKSTTSSTTRSTTTRTVVRGKKWAIAAIAGGIVAGGVGLGGSAGAADLSSGGSKEPPRGAGGFVVDTREESSTCEGNISCGVLGAACGLVDGTFNSWQSKDHGHAHGVCTWPWE